MLAGLQRIKKPRIRSNWQASCTTRHHTVIRAMNKVCPCHTCESLDFATGRVEANAWLQASHDKRTARTSLKDIYGSRSTQAIKGVHAHGLHAPCTICLLLTGRRTRGFRQPIDPTVDFHAKIQMHACYLSRLMLPN